MTPPLTLPDADASLRRRAAVTTRRRRRRIGVAAGELGSLAAELAVVTPLLTLLMLFVVLGGRVAQAHHDVTQATAEAARAVSLLRSGDPHATARAVLEDNLAAAGVRCRALASAVTGADLRPGGAVTVTARCEVDLTGVAGLGLPRTRAVAASSTEVVDSYRGGG